MFLDKVKISCKAGNGGNGAISFRREKFVPNGGPNGGDGGKGGDIILKANKNMNNLSSFYYKKIFKAQDGENGLGNNKYGKNGVNLEIFVPVGTIIKNAENEKILADLCESEDEIKILKGGLGGRGNAKFATSVKQAPKFSELGEKTKEYELILELKTIADVGIIGFPNVGKSSLLKSISNAKPKIANYHFTTLSPNIGVVNAYNSSFVVADIPGLISGASVGVGLGIDFLKHIERTRLLLHVIDISGSEGRDPFDDYLSIIKELKNYGENVSKIPQIVVLNKGDLISDNNIIENFKKNLGEKIKVFLISAVSNAGFNELLKEIVENLNKLPKLEKFTIEEENIDKKNKNYFEVKKVSKNLYEACGDMIDDILKGVVLSDERSNAYFQKRIKEAGIIDALLDIGLKEGDKVKLGGAELEYYE